MYMQTEFHKESYTKHTTHEQIYLGLT